MKKIKFLKNICINNDFLLIFQEQERNQIKKSENVRKDTWRKNNRVFKYIKN